MSKAETTNTIAGIQLDLASRYECEIDITKELEVVSRLRELSPEEFAQGMSALVRHLNNVPTAFLADRYVNLLVRMAGGEPSDSAEVAA